MSSRIIEILKGKKYKIIIEAGKHPVTGRRKRITRIVDGRKPKAEKLCADILRQLEQGTYIEPHKQTVTEYMEHWLETYAINLAPSTYAGYKRIVTAHISTQLGHIPLIKLQPIQVQGYYSSRLQAGLSATTVRQHHAILRQALEHAVKWQLIYRNPADLAEAPTRAAAEIFPLEPEQLDKLLAMATGLRDEYLYIVAAYTGMREGEILALTWPDVDIDGHDPVCRVRQTVGYINGKGFVFRPTAKSKRSRREIPLPDIAVTALKKQRAMIREEKVKAGPKYDRKSALVFPNKYGKPLDPSDMTRRFKRLVVKAGFPDVRFHDLRHTHATLLLKAGVHPKVVQERLGHQTIGITMDTYTHVLRGMQREAVDKLNEYLLKKNGHQMGTFEEKGRQ
ncbi:MAG: tyrosine-type recombinase/integrase [Syntrophales bacterium]|nr:tyrosine-type recombinase/integrase [Syntrophales bacterium]